MINFFAYLSNKIYLMTLPLVITIVGSVLPVHAHSKSIKEKNFSHSEQAETVKSILLAQNVRPVEPIQPPRPIEPIEPPRRELEPLPTLEDLLEQPPTQPVPQEDRNLPRNIVVKKFDVVGSTVFSDEELQAAIKDYIGRPLTFAELLQVETVLTKLYTDNGYINSGATIPEQNISQGIVKVQIIEGSLEELTVEVNGRLSDDYVRDRINLATKAPFNINKLQEALQLLQLDPLIANLTAELSVGSRRDRWTLAVEANQADAFEPVIFANNSRTPSVGSFQRGVEINHNNFAGEGDRLSLIYKNTDGSNDFEGNYTIPVNARNGTIGFRYRYVTSDIIEPPFEDLDIESKTDEYKFTFRQPIILTASSDSTQELALGLEVARQGNRTSLQNDPFPLSPGADDDGNTRIWALRLFQDWTRRTRRDVFAARSQFSVGLDIFDASVNREEPDSRFFAWRGQVQWLRQLNSSINLLLRSDIQLSTTDLVPLEQFSLGGLESVRGYRQDSLLGDSGVFASAEVRIPFYRWDRSRSSLSVIPFVDFGTVWGDSDIQNQEEDTLVSAGVGLQLDVSERLRARLDWGIPLIEVEDSDRTLQEDGVYFSVQYFPF
jgi:hemolysin activation/secretion protein